MGGEVTQPPPLNVDRRFRVLARKYRPTTFEALIGQEALVRTLRNAFNSGRVAHAWMLAGVRGVGKTTTARIIARALNCIGPDGTGGMTIQPCGVCEHCVAIAEDRHLDVIEMDAASHTGVDNIREMLDGVPYRPALARFKVYIIDEVHMLSEKAFNALLKTLEEPPEHVKFVFATTELRKVPVTVLSRCQRFDLRRVEEASLVAHLARVAENETVPCEASALRLVARAAEGSVRDALSLLDQAIAHGAGAVTDTAVQDMLGLVDRTVTLSILEAALAGDAARALASLNELHAAGADPAQVIEDLLRLVHWISRLNVAVDAIADKDAPEAELGRVTALAERVGVGEASRAWQLLLKGLGEIRLAPQPLHAAEMVLIRLAYAAPLPSPADVVAALTRSGNAGDSRGSAGGGGGTSLTASATSRLSTSSAATTDRKGREGGSSFPRPEANLARAPTQASTLASTLAPARASAQSQLEEAGGAVQLRAAGSTEPAGGALHSFADVVTLAQERKEGILHAQLLSDVHLVRFEPGAIEVRLAEGAPADLPQRLSRFLSLATGTRWLVTVSQKAGAQSLLEQRRAQAAAERADILAHPLVQAVLETFPAASVGVVRRLQADVEEEREE